MGLLDLYHVICFYGGGAKVTTPRDIIVLCCFFGCCLSAGSFTGNKDEPSEMKKEHDDFLFMSENLSLEIYYRQQLPFSVKNVENTAERLKSKTSNEDDVVREKRC